MSECIGRCAQLSVELETARQRIAALEAQQTGFQLRFDGPPGPEGPRFVEAETLDGHNTSIGEWAQDGDYWILVVRVFRSNSAESELEAARQELATLRDRVANAMENPTTIEGMRAAVLEALRG